MYFNKTGTVSIFIHFTPKSGVMNSSHLVRINNKSLQQVQSTKFLGIYLDNKLNWKTHVNNLCPKLIIQLLCIIQT